MREFAAYVRRNPSLGWGLGILLTLLLFSTIGRAFINKDDAYALATIPDLPPKLDQEELAKIGEVGTFRAKLEQLRLGLRPLFGTDSQGKGLLASLVLGTGMTLGRHPMALYRPALAARGVKRAVDLETCGDGRPVTVAGAVICRQRPGTAKGFMFLTLEDETGLVNVTVRPDLFDQRHQVLVTSGVLEIDGYLQSLEGISVRATEIRAAGPAVVATPSRDFR